MAKRGAALRLVESASRFGYLSYMKIGTIELQQGILLAPMEDVTDYPFRSICKRMGAVMLSGPWAKCVQSSTPAGILPRKTA